MLPLAAAQGGLRLRADAHSVLGRALLTSSTADDLRRGAVEPYVSLAELLCERCISPAKPGASQCWPCSAAPQRHCDECCVHVVR